MKNIFKMLSVSLWGIILCSSFISAEELTKEHTPIGTRLQSAEQRLSILESRAEMRAAEIEAGSNTSSNKMLKGMNAAAKKSIFYTSHPSAYQSVVSISPFSKTVELIDGSIWGVSLDDAHKILNWYPSDVVIVTPNHYWFSTYDFRLTNQGTGESVAVKMNLGPIAPMYHSPYTHWILSIDYYHNIVYLEDGSVWYMSTYDSGMIQDWIPGDVVIIGVNDGWLSSFKPNVLINVAMLNYAAGAAEF